MPAKCDEVIQHLLEMIDHATLPAIRQHGLDEMVRLTGSTLGVYATVDDTERSARLSLVSPAEPTSLVQPLFVVSALDPTSYWHACVVRREPVIRNESGPVTVPWSPPGEGPLQRDLTVPVFDGDRIVSVIGVANRATPYGPADALLLSEVAAGLHRVIVRKRLHDSLEGRPDS
jgi:GAF domain-containing protein